MMKIPARTKLDVQHSPGIETNEWKVERIQQWQEAKYTHPLTCGTQDCRSDLVGDEIEGEVVLLCECCGYVQSHIPDVVFRVDIKAADEYSWFNRD